MSSLSLFYKSLQSPIISFELTFDQKYTTVMSSHQRICFPKKLA